jgi:16S rRNA (adenine1518-N6/adenine1519-N6)-dimethyltransferase
MAGDAHGRRLHKAKLGQNFLVSTTASHAIVDALGDLSAATVLEIGAGKGALTRLLAHRASHLVAVELDPALAQRLKSEFADQAGTSVEILSQNILRVDLSRFRGDRFTAGHPDRLIVVGNLPYYITADILLHLFAHHAAIERAVLMVQREVADRIVACPGTRAYGALSATTQMYARAERLFTLPPGAFSPPPEVHSTVFRLTMQPRFQELGVDHQGFLNLVRQVFAQKRKTLANNLRAAGYEATQVNSALTECQLDRLIRAEDLSLESMARLFHALPVKGPPHHENESAAGQ